MGSVINEMTNILRIPTLFEAQFKRIHDLDKDKRSEMWLHMFKTINMTLEKFDQLQVYDRTKCDQRAKRRTLPQTITCDKRKMHRLRIDHMSEYVELDQTNLTSIFINTLTNAIMPKVIKDPLHTGITQCSSCS